MTHIEKIRLLKLAYARMEKHFGCITCRHTSPRWCADRNHIHCSAPKGNR